jgi:putative transposase
MVRCAGSSAHDQPAAFCRTYDELRNFLRSRSRTNQHVSADYRRFQFLRRNATVLRVLQAA